MAIKTVMTPRSFFTVFCFLSALGILNHGASAAPALVVSVPDQKLAVIDNGQPIAQFPISTSRYGLGDRPGSYATPVGLLEIAAKIGAAAPMGAVFKQRRLTGEILRPNARGRDPIVTRIIWLRGLERQNARAFERNIYIHGTPVERLIGRPASYGCIRMRSCDIVNLFASISVGTKIAVFNSHLPRAISEAGFTTTRLLATTR